VNIGSYHMCTFLTLLFQTVKRNQQQYDMPLKILSYDELYGWTMDAIVSQVGRKNNCTFCGVFRRQALDRGAAMLNVDHIVTGHNADDIAETVLMNSMSVLRSFVSFIDASATSQLCEATLQDWAAARQYAHKARIPSNDPSLSNTHTRRKS
jgi:PP-loop family